VGLGPVAASASAEQATTDVLAEMAPVTIAPGEHAAPEHIRSGRFQVGVAVGRRGLQTVTWPLVVATVNAAEYQVDQLVTLYAWPFTGEHWPLNASPNQPGRYVQLRSPCELARR